MNITMIPLSELKPNPRNVRLHSAKQLEEYRRSVEKFGQTSTVSFSDFMGTIVLTDKYPGESYSKKMDIKVVQ